MRFLWTCAIFWGLFFCIGSLAMKEDGSIWLFLVGCAPTGLLVWFLIHRASKREAVHKAMLQEAGVAQGSGFDHAEADTGIAINKQAKTLSLLIGGFYKTYPYSDIREWQAPGTDLNKPSFIVTVRDVDTPKWFISMSDKPTQARWMEILRQEINES